MKDLTATAARRERLARISIYDRIGEVQLVSILGGSATADMRGLAILIEQRAATPPIVS